jgi:hypothetical protein
VIREPEDLPAHLTPPRETVAQVPGDALERRLPLKDEELGKSLSLSGLGDFFLGGLTAVASLPESVQRRGAGPFSYRERPGVHFYTREENPCNAPAFWGSV